MREVVVQILHTQDGAKVAMHCFWFGTTKVRNNYRGGVQILHTQDDTKGPRHCF